MAISQWMDELMLGIEPFDTEHAGLFRLIDDLNNAMIARLGDVVLNSILEDLENYANTHFRHEEEFFERIGYPKPDMHIAEHQRFTNDIAGFRLQLFQNEVGLSVKVVSYLREWLNTHIKIKDGDYGKFARENGFAG